MLLIALRQVMFAYQTNNKLLTLVLACLFYNASTNANTYPTPTTAIPDVLFEQALINLNIDTNGLNGNILNSDAQAVTTLFIGNINVSDLTGIEAFENLLHLYAYNNNIVTANFSQNLALEIIDLDNNNLSSINISNNSALRELIISNNALMSIDVSDNLLLEYLSCNLNNLNTLDVSANENLSVLRCYSNNLQSINLNDNPALTMLFISDNDLDTLDVSMNLGLDTLTCDNNNLDTLDLSINTNLEYLGCSNNNLSELDITTNTGLTRILCNNNNLGALNLSNAQDLFLLYAMNNQIQSIDLTNNPDLRYFRAENNLLIKIDMRNGENGEINEFVTTQNSSLSCIYVDDSNASYLSDWDIDNASNFADNESECQTLTVQDNLTTDFTVYPNPASHHVNIGLNVPEATFKLFTIKGQLLFERPLTQGTNSVNISDFSSGLYVVAIQSEESITTRKLVIN